MSGFYPSAVVKNIPPGVNDPAIDPRLAILHVAVSEGSSLHDFFRDRSGGVESHFYIRRDGTVEQYRSIYFQADANLNANDFAVSIETQGMGAGQWTPNQIAAIKKLLVWLHKEADIPLVRCQSADGFGVGYHSQFRSWSPVVKSCPGPDRIKQFETVIVPWMNDMGETGTAPRVKSRGKNVDNAIKALRVIKARNPFKAAKVKAALKTLRSIKPKEKQ